MGSSSDNGTLPPPDPAVASAGEEKAYRRALRGKRKLPLRRAHGCRKEPEPLGVLVLTSPLPPTQTGGCLCGAVRYTLAEAPTSYGACHCSMCRKFSGGIELGLEVPADGVTFHGTRAIQTYRSSEWAERGFCGVCGSSLFWRFVGDGPLKGLMSLSAGSLDSLEGLSLETEVYIDSKPSGHCFAGERTRLTEDEVLGSVEPAPEQET